MNNYTSTIPPTLAEILKEKGMLIANVVDSITGEKSCRYTYAHIFDWLMERGLRIVIEPSWDFANERITDMWDCDIVKVGAFSSQPKTTISQHNTWHEAANAAIKKALTLI